jgi:hypothetical protein
MDAFDYREENKANGCSTIVWNLLTILALLSVVCVSFWFVAVFTNPSSAFNPFPPPTLPAVLSLPTSTPTSLIVMPATWTPTNSPMPSLTNTPEPTFTLPPTPTPFTFTPTPLLDTPIPIGGTYFEVRQGSPKAIPNIYHPELACNWMGVGGQAVDMSNTPVTGLIIRLGGTLPGVTIPEHMMSLTGVALNYGRAGYEFKLADKPIASRKSLWVQLLDQAGVPISEKIFFDTYDSCDMNLIIIDFKQSR